MLEKQCKKWYNVYERQVSVLADKKEKKYVSDNAQLMAEWDWERNTDFDPMQFTLGSNKKVWWRCSQGHEWQAIIANRHKGSACPYCSGRCAVKGKNDLETTNPALAKEWNYEKNGRLTPAEIMPNSGKRLWWKCGAGHEWQARIADRNKGKGCPYCTGQKVLRGYNDLATTHPTLAEEWEYDLNGELKPFMVTAGANKKVWWRCKNGHQWQAYIYSRSNKNGSNCPHCYNNRKKR